MAVTFLTRTLPSAPAEPRTLPGALVRRKVQIALNRVRTDAPFRVHGSAAAPPQLRGGPAELG
jgi:hypothetical protein